MANAVYPTYKGFILTAAANVSLDQDDTTNGPFCALVDTDTYTYSSAHDFYNDLSGVVGTDQRIASPTVAAATGVFDGGDLTYSSVVGNSVEALVIYRKNSGANTTWKLVCYIDTSVTGLPVTPNGGNITVTWNASGILLISDRRMKENIEQIGSVGQAPLYKFNYIGSPIQQIGFMAQDLLRIVPQAVVDLGPCLAVNYGVALEHL